MEVLYVYGTLSWTLIPVDGLPPSSAKPSTAIVLTHYSDVIMSAMAYQITSVSSVYSTGCSGADQRKHQSSALLSCVSGIHRDRWIPRTKGQWRGKCFHLMTSSCIESYMFYSTFFNRLRPWQNCRPFVDDIQIDFALSNILFWPLHLLKCVAKDTIDKRSAFVQIMTWRRAIHLNEFSICDTRRWTYGSLGITYMAMTRD